MRRFKKRQHYDCDLTQFPTNWLFKSAGSLSSEIQTIPSELPITKPPEPLMLENSQQEAQGIFILQ